MENLYILNETFSNGLSYNFLTVISLLSVLSGVLVIISKNPIVSVLFLIGLFFNIAGYLMMAGVNFIGLSYLLVYVGAVSILFLFILMLINVRISELVTDNYNSIPMAIITSIIFGLILYKLLPSNLRFIGNTVMFNNDINTNNLFFVSSQVWDSLLAESSHITSIGNVLYTVYPIWLVITSLILLLAMVGAIVITIKQ